MGIEQIKSLGGSQLALQQIIDKINDEGLKTGAPLGTAKDLVIELGSSERAVREAVLRLESLGVVESIKKSGIKVSKPNFSNVLSKTIAILGRNAETFHHLKELRYTLELGALRLAAQKINSTTLKRFRKLAGKYRKIVEDRGDHDHLLEIDSQYHELILTTTENPLIYEQHSVVSEYFKLHSKSLNHVDIDWETRKAFCWEHDEIINAMESGNIEYAEIILSRHLQRLLDEKPSKQQHGEKNEWK